MSQRDDELADEDNKSPGVWQRQPGDGGGKVDNEDRMEAKDKYPVGKERPVEADKKLEEMEENL
jgi:hypothetical protein